jgi:hypothetical protein
MTWELRGVQPYNWDAAYRKVGGDTLRGYIPAAG